MRRLCLITLLVAPLALTACGPDVEKDAEYANAWRVKKALLEAGHDCPGKHQVDNGTDAENVEFKIQCDESFMLETVTQEYAGDRDDNVASLHALTDLPNTLHGSTWVITSQDMDRLVAIQGDLGGKITAG